MFCRIHRPLYALSLALLLVALLPAGTTPTPALAQSNALLTLEWTAASTTQTQSVAWGDADNDGDLDLAVGNAGRAAQLYLNQNGTLALNPLWQPAASDSTAVAWGDLDNDGDLDLAVGGGAGLAFYLNCSTTASCANEAGSPLSSTPVATVASSQPGSLAFGDLDGDGLLDLVAGNSGAPNRIYRNGGNPPFFAQPDPGFNPVARNTRGVALGDADNDGDLDLAVANDRDSCRQGAQLYRNNGGQFSELSLENFGCVTSLAWGDADGDGDLDLALGRKGGAALPDTSTIVLQNCTVAQASDRCAAGSLLQRRWTIPGGGGTNGLAWGDVDGDGDLDLALANERITVYIDVYEGSQVLLNCTVPNPGVSCSGGQLFAQPVIVLPSPGLATSIAWGDVDGDGDLDLAQGVADRPNQLYVNAGTPLATSSELGASQLTTRGLAWGDVDGDRDLDLAVANDEEANQLFRNQNGALTLDPNWQPGVAKSRVVAWGDVDGDGDLDLAVGNEGRANQLYRNQNGQLALDPSWAPTARDTTALAWADLDSDGDLDLAVGNFGDGNQANQLYRNCALRQANDGCGAGDTALSATPFWQAPTASGTRALAWGDADADGDLDLAVGNENRANELYRNQNGALTLDPSWTPAPVNTTAVAWGDVDGDGDLDLAVGNFGQRSQLYRNQNGALALDPSWRPDPSQARSLVWGDVDGDRDLDLALGNFAEPSRLYRNSGGVLALDPRWAPPAANTRALAWGDVDADGDLDLAVGNTRDPSSSIALRSQLFRNTAAGGPPRLPNSPPSVQIAQPGPTAGANFFASPVLLDAPVINVPFTLADPEGDPVRVRALFSLDGGGSWRPALPDAATQTVNLRADPGGTAHNFGWNTFASGFFGSSDTVVVRIEAAPDGRTAANRAAALNQRPFRSAVSLPFRARGGQVQVLDGSQTNTPPAAGALVYRIPAGQTRGERFPAPIGSLAPLATNSAGYLQGRGQLAVGDSLVALLLAESTPRYNRYISSAAPTATGLAATPVAPPGVQRLIVSPANQLLLFNLKIGLEWDARSDQRFMNQLRYDLQRASELLYDWSDGQVALGELTILHDRQGWETADVQIYATNRLRPNATQGGITTREFTETLVIDGAPRATSYAPGAVRIGATWNRNGDASGAIGEDWPRTLAHELGHYALYLDDNYLGLNSAGELIAVENCRGAMSDPYRDDYSEFQPGGAEWDANCAETLSERNTGRADWETIGTFYPQLRGPAGFDNNPGPALLPLAVTSIGETAPSDALALDDVGFGLAYPDGRRYGADATSRALLYRADGTRVTDLGTPALDQLLARGARAGDELCVYALQTGYIGCERVSAGDSQLTMQPLSDWRPSLVIAPQTPLSVAVSLGADGVGAIGDQRLLAQIFPDEGPPSAVVPLALQNGAYVGTIGLSQEALGGLARVWVEGATPRRELVADYSLGGNPVPRRRPRVRNQKNAPALSPDGQVILFADNIDFDPGRFYAFQTATLLPNAPPWAVPVSAGYYLSASAGAPDLQAAKAALSMAYLEADVPPGSEDGIGVYFLPAGGSWQRLRSTLDGDENTAATVAAGPGLYVLMTSLPLRAGWNLVAYPWPQTGSVAETLNLIGGAGRYRAVYGYNAQADDPWQLYDAAVPADWAPVVNDLETLEYGRGYWINVSEGPPAVQNTSDQVLVPPPATYYGAVPNVAADATLTVDALVGNRLCASTQTLARTIGGVAQAVFVLTVPSATEQAGCGSAGAPVSFVIRNGDNALNSATMSWNNSHAILVGFNQLYLPLIVRESGPSLPDLVVSAIELVPTNPRVGEPVELRVTIRNNGPRVSRSFWVDLYVDPNNPPAAGQAWSELSEFGVAWRVYGLAPGETRVLSSRAPNDPADPSRSYSNFVGFGTPGTHTLYAQVDAYGPNGDPAGAIEETNESNNLGGPREVEVDHECTNAARRMHEYQPQTTTNARIAHSTNTRIGC